MGGVAQPQDEYKFREAYCLNPARQPKPAGCIIFREMGL